MPLSRCHLMQASTGTMPAVTARVRAATFVPSYRAGARDEADQFAGGTEMRLLAAHAGKLYAGNGYREERPGGTGGKVRKSWFLVRPTAAGGSIMHAMSGD